MIVETNYMYTRRVDVSEYFEGEEKVEIEMRELGGVAAAKLKKMAGDDEAMMSHFLSLLPWVIVDHDFWKDATHKLTSDEEAQMVAGRAELAFNLMSRYVTEVLFTHGKKSV